MAGVSGVMSFLLQGLERSSPRILSAQVVVGLRGGSRGGPGPTPIIPALAQGYAGSWNSIQSRIIPSKRGVDNPDPGPLDRGITRLMQDLVCELPRIPILGYSLNSHSYDLQPPPEAA